jgi:geranylgeranyl transferase type-2 subunit beta
LGVAGSECHGSGSEFDGERGAEEGGGIADKPGNVSDVYHTYFGVAGTFRCALRSPSVQCRRRERAGLALLDYPGVVPVDSVYALPLDVLRRLGPLPGFRDAASGTGAGSKEV